jgi:biotin carboxyl carrier protein
MEVRVRERTHRIDLRANGPEWVAVVDDRPWRVNLVRAGERWSLLLADANGDATASRSYDVAFERSISGDLLVHIDGAIVPVSLPARAGAAARRRGRAGSESRGGQVVAPMPGRVVSVLVERGDEVSERQGVVVLEAMKMQNEVRAARAGVVIDVRVSKGSAVDAGAVLVVIGDPHTVERS